MFSQFIIKDLGKSPEEFDLETYWDFEDTPIQTSRIKWFNITIYDE